jgi:hypothetical protein
MIDDPIVQEIHETRRRIMAECGDDVERLIDRLKAAELQDKDRLVTKEELNRRLGSSEAAI